MKTKKSFPKFSKFSHTLLTFAKIAVLKKYLQTLQTLVYEKNDNLFLDSSFSIYFFLVD